MANIFNILIVGLGGQGIITLGNIFREYGLKSASIINVVGTETRGVAQRGGSVISTVRYLYEPNNSSLDEGFVYDDLISPVIQINDAHLVIGIEPLETLRNIKFVSKKTKIILNTLRQFPKNLLRKGGKEGKKYPNTEEIVSTLEDLAGDIIFENFNKISQEKLKHPIYSNIIMLGRCIKEFPDLFDKGEVLSLLSETFKDSGNNKLAYDIGYNLQ